MTIEKVKTIALEKYGKKLTDVQAAGYAEKYGKLSDDELDNVAGGGCSDGTSTDKDCPSCQNGKLRLFQSQFGSLYKCPECGYEC